MGLVVFLLSGTTVVAAADPPAIGAVPIRGVGSVRVTAPPGRRPVYSEKRVRRLLSRYVGRTVSPAAVRGDLERRYRFFGYQPIIEVSASDGILEVRVRDSRFVLQLMTRDPGRLEEIGVGRRDRGGAPVSIDTGIPDWILRQNLLAAPGDTDNIERYRQERFRLARFGYDIAFIPGQVDPDTGFESAAYLLVPRGGGGRPDDAGEPEPPDRNYLGGAFEYGPRRGAQVRLVYRRAKWLTPFDALAVSPEYGDEIGGELTYRTDYLFHESVRRNVSLAARLFSDNISNRVINGVETDERREGVRLFSGVELLPEKQNHDWEVGLEFERSTIELDEVPVLPQADDFAFVRVISKYTYRHLYRPANFQWRMVPTAVFSLTDLGGEVDYQLYALDSDLHARSRRRWEYDLHVVGGVMGGDVPPTERLTLGGSRTVRGFEQDDFAGEQMVAVQTELWFPLSSGRPGSSRFLSRLRGALFVDGGAISDGPGGASTDIAGAGAGLRYHLARNPLYFKFDYGFGIHGGGDGNFYLTLALRY